MQFLESIINYLADPKILITIAAVLLFTSLRFPDKFYNNRVAVFVFSGMALFLAISVFNPDFRLIVTKADNVPIVGMLFLVPFFTWFSLREGVNNDKRIAEGKP